MAIQRIGGQMLESNLTRVSDLAFQTDLLYLDVDNSRVGIRTSAPGNFALDVNGTARFQNSVSITGDLTVTGFFFVRSMPTPSGSGAGVSSDLSGVS